MTTPSCPEETVRSVHEYVRCVKHDTRGWKLSPGCSPWFRGQSDSRMPPLPGIFRPATDIEEVAIAGRFKKLARMFGETPSRDMNDEWLYLMQHVGIPTRLLDWSEGALIGLYFAVRNASESIDPCVWLVHPLKLNEATIGEDSFPEADHDAFIRRCDLAFRQVRRAPGDLRWPIAIIPTYIHPRMRSQRGCFTLHGASPDNFECIAREAGLIEQGYFRKYRIPCELALEMLRDLRVLGITHSTLFPDQDGLAIDLKQAFREQKSQ